MNKNKIFIAEKTLKLLETEPWNKINLNKVLGKNNKDIFRKIIVWTKNGPN